jgi:cell division protein FtsW
VRKEEKLILISYFTLLLIGLVLMFELSELDGKLFHRQLAWAMLGITAMFWIWRADDGWILDGKVVWMLYLLSIFSLVLVFTPIGMEINGSRRWIKLGPAGLQPSEFAKIFVLPLISRALSRRGWGEGAGPVILGFSLLLPALLLIGAEPDFGFAILIIAVFFAMSFAAGVGTKPLLGFAIAVVFILSLSLLISGKIDRILGFISGTSYHVVQARTAVGSGGLEGCGIGDSWYKYHFIPYPYSDSIFSIIGEEFGFIGSVAVILLYWLLSGAGFSIALMEEGERRILGVGLSFAIGFQAFLAMGVGCGALPPKGLCLPLISYGGSSLLATSMAIGILLSISRGLRGW